MLLFRSFQIVIWLLFWQCINVYKMTEDINATLTQYNSLKPSIELYTYDTGEQSNLVALTGTVPIYYRKTYYHIPVAIYLPYNFPDSAPICYVRPTITMSIKESKYVDSQGRVLLPYLQSWTSKNCLTSLLQVMVIVFSETPPVYQKAKQQQTVQNPPNVTSWNAQGASPSGGYPYNNPYAAKSTPGAYPGGNYNWYNNQQPAVSQQPSPYPSSASNSSISSATGANSSASRSPCELTDKDIRASLMSAVGDRVRRRLNERIEQYNAETEVLKKTEDDLTDGKRELESIIQKMENDTLTLQETKRQIEQRSEQLDQALVKVEQDQDKFNVDESYGPNEPLFKQYVCFFLVCSYPFPGHLLN
jgi:ESCRT-I complex subunit TSG101